MSSDSEANRDGADVAGFLSSSPVTVFSAGFLTYLALVVAIGAQTLFLLRQILRRDRAWTALGICFVADVVLILAGAAGVGAVAERAPWLLTALTAAGVAYLLWFGLSALRSARRGGRTLEAAAAEVRDDAWAPSAEEVALMTGRLPVVVRDVDGTGVVGTAAGGIGGPGAASGEGAAVGRSAAVAVETRRAPAHVSAAPAPAQSSVRKVVLLALSVSLLNPHAILDAVVMMGTFAQAYGDARWLYAGGALAASAVWFVVLGWGGSKLAPLMNTPRTWRIVDTVVGVLMLGLAVKIGLTLL